MTKKKCVMLLGAPHSGTTLLATAIGSHEKICMLDEDFHLSVRKIVGGKIRAVKLCVPNMIQMRRKWRTWWGIVRKNGYLRKRLHYILPRSYYSLEDYLEFFDCQIICILREPEKALSALNTRGLIKMSPAKRAINKAYDIYEELVSLAPDKVTFVSFDEYLMAPEDQTRKLCNFLGVEFSPEMLEAPNRNLRYPGEAFDESKIGSENYNFETMDPGVKSIVRRYQKLKALVL